MFYLLDNNILIRYAVLTDPNHKMVYDAVTKLLASQEELYYTTQNLA